MKTSAGRRHWTTKALYRAAGVRIALRASKVIAGGPYPEFGSISKRFTAPIRLSEMPDWHLGKAGAGTG